MSLKISLLEQNFTKNFGIIMTNSLCFAVVCSLSTKDEGSLKINIHVTSQDKDKLVWCV